MLEFKLYIVFFWGVGSSYICFQWKGVQQSMQPTSQYIGVLRVADLKIERKHTGNKKVDDHKIYQGASQS